MILKDVIRVLQECPETRSSDRLLILEVYRRAGGGIMTPFADIMRQPLQSWETITRCRRKAQELYPELRATEQVQEYRAERKILHKELARDGFCNLD